MIKNKDFLVLLIRLFLGYVFFSSGICKLTHGNFGQLIGPPWLEEALAKHGLAFFAQVVAVCQVVLGTLLFTQRFSTLGAVMLVPMNISILAVTVSQNWTGTPYVNAVFLALNLALLLYEYKRFQFLLSTRELGPGAPSALEIFRAGPWPWGILASAFVTLVLAPVHYPSANVAGAITFILVGTGVLVPAGLTVLQKVIAGLAIVNMLLMTVAKLVPAVPMVVVLVSGLILVLLLVTLWIGSRKTTMPALSAT